MNLVTKPLRLRSSFLCGAHDLRDERARAASPEILHLDVLIGEADSWDVTSTLIYGKSEAILVVSRLKPEKHVNTEDLRNVGIKASRQAGRCCQQNRIVSS
jgi:hypothetical protein